MIPFHARRVTALLVALFLSLGLAWTVACHAENGSTTAAPTVSGAADDPQAEAALHDLIIRTDGGDHVFRVEMAVTPEERRQGLMFRDHLGPDRGMLFDNGRDQVATMWMKNTLISLDMLFIDRDGRIASIAENTEPLSTAVISSGVPVRAVLEVPGGTAARLDIRTGDRVSHPMFASP